MNKCEPKRMLWELIENGFNAMIIFKAIKPSTYIVVN